jgi:hypothetical protein
MTFQLGMRSTFSYENFLNSLYRKVNTTLDFDSGHVRLVMNEGSKCKGDSLTSSTVIEFTCDTSAGKGFPRLVAQLPPGEEDACGFFLEWKTKVCLSFVLPCDEIHCSFETARL